jgi:subtilase family serine protease
MKELLLQKSVKYIERTFSKDEVAEIVKQNGGVDVYSENAKDQIKVFLQLHSLSPIELEKLLIKYSDIEGFDRMESVYRKLAMFNTDESKQTREKMKSVALEKYKKELTDSPVETNNINDDDENDLINLSDQLTIPKSKDNSSNFWVVLIICCFIVTIIPVAVVVIFRKRKSSPTIPTSKL